MSNYLDSLVAKNLAPLEGVHPRPHLRFEERQPADISREFGSPGMALPANAVPVEMMSNGGPQLVAPPPADSAASPQRPDRSASWEQPIRSPSIPAPTVSLAGPTPAPTEAAPIRTGLPVGYSDVQPYRGRLDTPTSETKPLRTPESPAPPISAAEPLVVLPSAAHPSPETKPVKKPEPLAPPGPAGAPPIVPLPASVAVQPETPRRKRTAPEQESGDHPLHPQDRLPALSDQTRELALERIVARMLVPSVAPQNMAPGESQARLNPARRESGGSEIAAPQASPASLAGQVVQPLRPIVQPLPELACRNNSPPAPTVNVTIGRIEVRSAPSAPPPRRPVPKPNIMSLDDYLYSRTNGDRR